MQSPYLSGAAITESLIVPVDTGNKQIKTPHHIFTAGLTCHDSYPPFGKDVIQYNGKYYTLSDQRVPYMRDKTADERYFILCLFGIACELRDAVMDAEERTNIVLLEESVALQVAKMAREFVEDFFNRLREQGIDLKTYYTVFVGGGSILFRPLIESSDKLGRCTFVEEIKSNTIGYQRLYQLGLWGDASCWM